MINPNNYIDNEECYTPEPSGTQCRSARLVNLARPAPSFSLDTIVQPEDLYCPRPRPSTLSNTTNKDAPPPPPQSDDNRSIVMNNSVDHVDVDSVDNDLNVDTF